MEVAWVAVVGVFKSIAIDFCNRNAILGENVTALPFELKACFGQLASRKLLCGQEGQEPAPDSFPAPGVCGAGSSPLLGDKGLSVGACGLLGSRGRQVKAHCPGETL